MDLADAFREVADEQLEVVRRLRKDIAEAAQHMDPEEAHHLVDLYYLYQHNRIIANNQVRTIGTGKSVTSIAFIAEQSLVLEHLIASQLNVWTNAHPLSVWARGILGIGPVLAAGLRAHIDINRAPTPGHIWRFAGLDSRVKWLGKEKAAALVKDVVGDAPTVTYDHIATIAERTFRKADRIINLINIESKKDRPDAPPAIPDDTPFSCSKSTLTKAMARRPWNARLKMHCFKIGTSFVKVAARPADIYGKLYHERKAFETEQNEKLAYKDQADEGAARVGKSTEAYKWYIQGKLPPGHLHMRAMRHAVKLFLAHYHHVAHVIAFGKVPPPPYPIAHLGHTTNIPVPNFDPTPWLKP